MKSSSTRTHYAKQSDTPSKLPSTRRSSKRDELVTLQYGKNCASNFAEFERGLEVIAGIEYGTLFTFARTGSYPVFINPRLETMELKRDREVLEAMNSIPDPIAQAARIAEIQAEYVMPQAEWDAYNESFREEWKATIKQNTSDKAKMTQDKAKLFWLMRGNMSIESTDKVREHMLDDWDQLKITQCPLTLYNAIKVTHTAFTTGANRNDASEAKRSYHEAKQGQFESLADYKDRMETMIRAMTSLGLAAPVDPAADMITGVNSTYMPAKCKIDDNHRMGGNYPATMFEAYKMLSELTPSSKGFENQNKAVFTTVSRAAPKKQFGANFAKPATEHEKEVKPSYVGKYGGKHGSKKDNTTHPRRQNSSSEKPKTVSTPVTRTYLTKEESEEVFNFTTLIYKSTNVEPGALKGVVLIDNQAQSSIFGNSDLLDHLTSKDSPSHYKGIGGRGEPQVTALQHGTFLDVIDVDYSPEADANILSWSHLRRQGFKTIYDEELDEFKLYVGNSFITFEPFRGLYAYRPETNTVLLTRKAEMELEMAAEVERRLAYPAKSGLENLMRSGAILNLPVGTEALNNLPVSIPHMQGKSPARIVGYPPAVYLESLQDKPRSTVLHCDLMFVKPNEVNLIFLVSVSDFGLTVTREIKNKGLGQLVRALCDTFKIFRSYSWKIRSVVSDGEGGIAAAMAVIEGPPHDPIGSGTHDGKVEERIRRIKDNLRSIAMSLPYKFGDALTTWAVLYSTYVLNLMPARVGCGMCPREILTGRKPEFKKVLPIAFGDFCQVQEKRTLKGVWTQRTVSALAILPSGNGPVRFVSLATGKIIFRSQFKIMKMIPYEYVILIQALQKRENFATELSLEDEESDEVEEPSYYITPPAIETPIEIVEERAPREDDPEIQAGTEIAEDARLVAKTLSNSGDPTVQEHPYSYIFMTTKESIDSFGFEATHVSVRKELQHMIDKGVFEVVNLSEHSKIDKQMIVPSKLFVKEKYGGVKLNEGPTLNFLGMNFDFGSDKKVRISIDIKDIVKGIDKTHTSPAGLNLFNARDDLPPIDGFEREKFHSTVAKLLYIAKRTRGDILLPVNYLCSRVLCPNQDDLVKLERILRYLNATKDMVLELTMLTNEDESVDLNFYVDASYATHSDMKSHSGVSASIGSGSLYVASTKQKCMSKSSTEAELIAVTDYIGEALQLKGVLEDITGRKINLVIHQDNQATMQIIKNGHTSGKSKHVKVRIEWIKERVDLGDFSFKYCSTKVMPPDGHTKPKQSEDFVLFRNGLGIKNFEMFKERVERNRNVNIDRASIETKHGFGG